MPVTPAPPAGDVDVSLESLLEEMVSLDALTRAPSPDYEARQSSSYDRASVTVGDAAGWFANADNGQFQEVVESGGRTEYVLLDSDGPGALTRIWSANPQGTLRVFVDGEPTPAIEADMATLTTGGTSAFPEPFAYRAGRGANFYFPIPYARHVRVTTDRQERLYYHVGYRTFDASTRVESYSRAVLARAESKVVETARLLAAPPRPEPTHSTRLEVTPGQPARTTFALDGPAAIERISLSVDPADPEVLRRTALLMRFDGHTTVRAPLGDFFGTGPGANHHEGYATAIDGDGLHAYFVMPFRTEAELQIEGPLPVTIAVDTAVRPYDWNERSRYFYAHHRPYEEVEFTMQRDLPFLEVEGEGHYIGNVLNVANSSRVWWGEGDEKIWIDDDAFPSIFGTGTEDYYGYAYCATELFQRPYHGQTVVDGPDNHGRYSMHRFHVLDPIPFRERIRFDLEAWHWVRYARVGYDGVLYWYAAESAVRRVPESDTAPFVLEPVPENPAELAEPSDLPHNTNPSSRDPFHCGPPSS
jgi:hypothetical protein